MTKNLGCPCMHVSIWLAPEKLIELDMHAISILHGQIHGGIALRTLIKFMCNVTTP